MLLEVSNKQTQERFFSGSILIQFAIFLKLEEIREATAIIEGIWLF